MYLSPKKLQKLFYNSGYKIPIRYHWYFWIGYFVLNVIRWGSYFNDYWYAIKSNLVEFPLHILIVYYNIYYLFPFFILRKKYYHYFSYFSLSLFLLYIIRTGLIYFLVSENIWPEAEGIQKAFTFNHFVAVILGEIYVIALVSAIKLIVDWVYEKNRVKNLELMQHKTELQFLKAQIQPHFFFNTLNNLYALTLSKSKKAPEVILKLSEFMEYILYDAKEPQIKLHKEIQYIQNYIDLEKLRYGKKASIEMSISGAIESDFVPPLLFLPFIENCFKHGAKENNQLSICIHFEKTSNHTIKFSVINTYNQFTNKIKKHGIGNENIRRRLELLYPNKHRLDIKTKKQNYIVNLTLQLKS